MIETFTPEPAAAWLSLRLNEQRDHLAAVWGAAFPMRGVYLAELIGAIAEYLCRPPDSALTSNSSVMQNAAALGALRFTQGASVPQLLREYQVLADLLEEFLAEQVRRADAAFATDEVVRAMHSVTQSVRVLQQQSVEAFVQKYTDTIERQSGQLVTFGRVVGQEMRQPLSVLRLLSAVVPIREGDDELTHLLDVFDRNVRRLADVASRLERLSHESLEAVVSAPEAVIHLEALVGDVVRTLRELARAHDVRIHIDSDLPRLRVDPTTTEMVFVSLLANAIKYSDPQKPARLIEVLALHDRAQPTVIVRDNGVGMPARRVQHLFREFTRAHGHRDRDQHDHGLGLGLSVVRNSMDAAGGTVWLESSQGVGTTVTLAWPARTNASDRFDRPSATA